MNNRLSRHAPFLAWPVLAAVTLLSRAPLAIDETRYLTVAWEMFTTGQWLVPTLNGEVYTAKPPLLFWLITVGWHVFGVSEWWPRLLPLLAGLAAWVVLWRLAVRLWGAFEGVAPLAVIVAGGMLAWVALSTTILFDMLLTLCVLLGLLGLVEAAAGRRRGWVALGLGIGFGALTKGPVVLLYLLPVALVAPWWSVLARARPLAWYGGLAGGVMLGTAIPLAWAVPAILLGGEEYTLAVLWQESAGRVTDSFAHARPWWWYLPLLPLLLLPWTLWKPGWRALIAAAAWSEPGARFCIAWVLPALLMLSAVSGKQAHYLLPALPALALLLARALATGYAMSYRADRLVAASPWLLTGAVLAAAPWIEHHARSDWLLEVHPIWGVGMLLVAGWAAAPFRMTLTEGAARLHVASALALALGAAGLLNSAAGRAYAVGPAASEVAALQAEGVEVAYYGAYHGQVGFAGRLQRPLVLLERESDIVALARRGPGAFVLLESSGNPLSAAPTLPVAAFAYRSGYWSLWPVAVIAADPGVLARIGALARAGAAESTE